VTAASLTVLTVQLAALQEQQLVASCHTTLMLLVGQQCERAVGSWQPHHHAAQAK
jgi:hypothetical protein